MSENSEKKVHGIVAEYDSVDTLLDACRRVRDAGYTKIDAFTPFAVHGIDKALGIKPTVLPWIVLAAGLTGTATAMAMQIWMNAIDYPYIISGKPYISLPAFMPVAFELTVLFSSFGAFFGMWALNGLPRYSNPVFTDPRFDRVTDDRFFLYIDAKDERFESDGVEQLLGETGTSYVQSVVDDDSSPKVPKPFFMIWGLIVGFSVIPLLMVLKMRVTNSSSPRFHVFYDMDFSPAKDAQQSSTLFADGRAMRPDVPGTVARGELANDMDFLTGIDMEALAQMDPPRADRLVRGYLNPLQQDDAAQENDPDPQSETEQDSPQQEGEQSPSAEDESESPQQTPNEAVEEVTAPDETSPAEQAGNAQENSPRADQKQDEPSSPEAEKSEAEKSEAEKSEAEESDGNDAAGETPSVMDTTPWLKENPLEVNMELVQRGQKYFGIYCSVCHGMNGGGNGLVNRRAQKILASTWIPPSSLHQDILYEDQYPDGKLFSTISNGIRKMPGYASQIKAGDRWAIVAYVRALQRSQNASLDLVPQAMRDEIEAKKAEVDQKLKEQAEAEKKAEEERAKKAAPEAT